MKALTEKSRQNFWIILCLFFVLFGLITKQGLAQSKIDYSIKSNIMDPDTLVKGSIEHKVFWHFVDWTSKEVKEIEILTLKEEFEKLSIKTEDETFDRALLFFDVTMYYHKVSVEQWENFKGLAPDSK